jgi:hypothetical protein
MDRNAMQKRQRAKSTSRDTSRSGKSKITQNFAQ